MNKTQVYAIGNPGTFDLSDKNDPLYYMARYAHEQSWNLYLLNFNEFEFRQNTQEDMEGVEQEFDNFLGDIATWLDSAVAASMAEEAIPSLPDIPAMTEIEADDAATSIWWLVIKFLLWYVLLQLKKRLEGGTDVSEIANILRKAMLKKPEGGSEFSIFEQLANTPLEIILSRLGEYQDFLYSDRPEV